jgi:predicted permease
VIPDFGQDLRYAARSLRRTPGFTAAAVVTLALGIGANSAIFTLLDAVMFKPLPLPKADELVVLYENPVGPGAPVGAPDVTGGTGRYLRFSYPRFQRLQNALADMGTLTATTRTVPFAVRLDANAAQTINRGQLVAGNYFALTQITPERGRPISDSDLAPGAPSVAVVSDGFWKRSLGGSAEAIGRSILVNRVPVTIVGVAPRGFFGTWTDAESDLWMPLTMQQTLGYRSNASGYGGVDLSRPWLEQNGLAWLNVVGRIPPERRQQAEAALKATNRAALLDLSLEIPNPAERPSIVSGQLVVEPFVHGFSGLRGRFATSLIALASLVALVLLIACANIANLLMVRSTSRAREIGIRIALGAGRARLIRQTFTESLLLAIVGGAVGFVAGQWASRALAQYALGPSNNPLPTVFEADSRAMLFATAATIATAFIFGLLPAVRATRGDLLQRLTGGRGVVSRSIIRGMRPLVVGQLALSFVVVFAAGLLGRTLVNFSRVDPGYSLDHVIAVSMNPRVSGYTPEQLPALRDRLVAATTSLPGITSAVVSSCGLLANCTQSSGFQIGDRPGIQLNENGVGPGYFATVGIPLKRGREFTSRDVDTAPLVAIVSESVARGYFAGANPIGQQIRDGDDTAEIVGVVGDTRPLSLRDAPVPMVYVPIAQSNEPFYTLAVRVTADAGSQSTAIERAIKTAEPALVLESIGAMSTYVAAATGRERLVTYLVAAMGTLALLLACVGLYGVLSFAVAGRTPEFGVRVALGATPANLRDIVLRDAIPVIAGGTVIGVAGAYWVNQLIKSLLFEVGVLDPFTGVVVAGLLIGSALAACSLPARRASRVDPIQALRAE